MSICIYGYMYMCIYVYMYIFMYLYIFISIGSQTIGVPLKIYSVTARKTEEFIFKFTFNQQKPIFKFNFNQPKPKLKMPLKKCAE